MATSKSTDTLDQTTQHAERAAELGRRVAVASIDAYERAWGTVADVQEQLASQAQVDWIADAARAQARYTRDTAQFSAELARDLVR